MKQLGKRLTDKDGWSVPLEWSGYFDLKKKENQWTDMPYALQTVYGSGHALPLFGFVLFCFFFQKSTFNGFP